MQKKRRTCCFALAFIFMVSLLAGCGGNAGSGGDTSFTWWILQSADSSYYPSYEENPAVKYMLSKTYNNNKIELRFMVPVRGSEQDNFNTLLSTGEYADIMAMTMYSGSIVELYEEGIILDLTEYIERYMPNYRMCLKNDPEVAMYAAHIVNGERKNLVLLDFGDAVGENWCGYQYRRDWVVTYGRNPFNNSPYTGGYAETLSDGSPDKNTWADDVVFPSGGAHPLYISDWEWMLEIFARAINDLGIPDGYPMSIYYPGVTGTGDMFCGFGGGGPAWYKDKNNKITFGAVSDDMRAYLQCVNTWFKNGWIDKAFAERSADMFYRIDDVRVRQGKVGLWLGIQGQLGGNMDDGGGYTAGIVSFGARQPINDLYGGPEQRGKEPFAMYQLAKVGGSVAITNKTKEKDLETLFTFLDSLYTREGGLLIQRGLSKEQYEETKDAFYTRHGLTEGAYRPLQTDTGVVYEITDVVFNDTGTLAQAAAALRLGLGLAPASVLRPRGSKNFLHSLDEWIAYENTGFLQPAFTALLPSEDARIFSRAQTQIDEFIAKNLPLFVRGEKDPFNNDDWNTYVNALGKYNPDRVTVIFQKLLDTLTN